MMLRFQNIFGVPASFACAKEPDTMMWTRRKRSVLLLELLLSVFNRIISTIIIIAFYREDCLWRYFVYMIYGDHHTHRRDVINKTRSRRRRVVCRRVDCVCVRARCVVNAWFSCPLFCKKLGHKKKIV